MPLAYSYIRFSSRPQERGDSLRRQKQLAVDYCAKNGLELVSTSYADLGLSAYKGANAKVGKLGEFVYAVEEGIIAADSWLLVESLDRLSRDNIDAAVGLFLRLKGLGITIVSLQDGKIYKGNGGGSNDSNTFDLMMAMMVFMRANNESETKAKRVKASWDNKRASGKPMTRMCPAWLRWSDDDNKWVIIEPEANKIRKIFELAAQGMGGLLIAQTMNNNGMLCANGGQWAMANVLQKLRHASVIGVLDNRSSTLPPVPNYYPPIISEELFHKVGDMISARHKTRVAGRSGNIVNLFVRKLYCGDCGGIVRIVGSKRGDRYYYRCQAAYQSSACNAGAVNMKLAESILLSTMFIAIAYTDYYNGGGDNNNRVLDEIKQNDESIAMLVSLVSKGRLEASPLLAQIELLQGLNKDLRGRLSAHPVTTIGASYTRAKTAYTALQCIISGQMVGDVDIVRKALRTEITRLVDRVVIAGADITDGRGKYRPAIMYGEICRIGGRNVVGDDGLAVRIGVVVNPDGLSMLDLVADNLP